MQQISLQCLQLNQSKFIAIKLFTTILFTFLFVFLCSLAIKKPTPLPLQIPTGWPKPPSDIFKNNKPTVEGFALGRQLFYDGNLSSDGNISCESCHQQFASFATFDHDLSHGVNNTFSTRNAPALFNLAWMEGFHWDGGINHIEVQPVHPFTSPNEMGETIENVLAKLNANAEYRSMFKAAFGDEKATGETLMKSLAQFTGSIVSSNSKYDRVMRGEDEFNSIEKKGYELFKQNCSSCHKEPLFTDNSYRNNGMPLNRFNDVGRMLVTGRSNDSLKFKVPSLRNIQVSYPYMHDGSIFSVPQVVDHYLGLSFESNPFIDTAFKRKIELTPRQKNELIYFLYALTDSTLLKDERFGPPKRIF